MSDEQIEGAILFADLSGFTALTEAHGDTTAVELLQRFYSLASAALCDGARLVKTIGDAVMVFAPTPTAAMRTARLLRHAVHLEQRWPSLRSGLHAGPVIERGGDSFGATVNLASRVAAQASPGQILCTRTVVRALSATEFVFRPLGEVRFKNVLEACEVFELVDGESSSMVEVDPVCRMRVDPFKAIHHFRFEGATYFFCSARCATVFAATPGRFIRPT